MLKARLRKRTVRSRTSRHEERIPRRRCWRSDGALTCCLLISELKPRVACLPRPGENTTSGEVYTRPVRFLVPMAGRNPKLEVVGAQARGWSRSRHDPGDGEGRWRPSEGLVPKTDKSVLLCRGECRQWRCDRSCLRIGRGFCPVKVSSEEIVPRGCRGRPPRGT